MGFNKRYINLQILSNYKKRKLNELISFIKKPDCLIYEDEQSEKICRIIIDNNDKLVKQKLIEIGFYEPQ